MILSAALAALGACAHAPSLNPDKASPEAVTAEGSADFDSRDLAISRERAGMEAEKAAVRRVAELFMDETSMAENYSRLDSGLLANAGLYVAKHKIIYESRDGDSYRVREKVWVYHSRVAADLRGSLPRPSAAGTSAALAFRGAPAPAFLKAFKEAFVKRSVLSIKDFPFTRAGAVPAGPDNLLLSAAASSGADLLFSASASASASGSGLSTGFYPSTAEASVRVYDAKSGKLLFNLSSQANAVDSSETASFEKALAAAGELLAHETAVKTDRLVKPESLIRLKVAGLDGFETLEKLKAELLGFGLKGLRLDSYSDGTAYFDVIPLRPDPQEFASFVLKGDSLGLQLDGVAAREVSFSLAR